MALFTRRLSTLLIVLLLLLFTGHTYALPFFDGTYQQALTKAKGENKKILLYFTAKWCGPCLYMEKNVFNNDSINRVVEPGFVALKLNYDAWATKPLVDKYTVGGLPTFIILDAQEVVEKRTIGLLGVHQLINFLSQQPTTDQRSMALVELSQVRYVQRETQQATWKVELGLQAGTNLMVLSNLASRTRIGYEVGILLVCTKRRLSLRPGLNLVSKGGKFTDNQILRLQYVELPIHISYLLRNSAVFSLPGGYRANLSPYVATLFTNRDLVKSLDYGTKGGLSVFIGRTSHLEAQVGYNFGLSNSALSAGQHYYNRGFYLSVLFVM